MSAFVIDRVDWEAQVKPYRSAAAKERVSLADGPQKDWWGVFVNDHMVSFGFIWIKNGIARIGGLYTLPEFRNRGAGQELAEFLMNRAREECCSGIDLFSVNPPFWERYGFVRQGKNGAGVDLMFKVI